MTLIPYGLRKRFKRGITITMILTYKCNLDCFYCTNKLPTGKRPKAKESTIDQLKIFINTFPYKIREVHISGGSPELHPNFNGFVNWLLEEKYFVKVFTNLNKHHLLYGLKWSNRLMLVATFHHSDNYNRFNKVYKVLKKVMRVELEEIQDGEPQYYFESRFKPLETAEILKQDNKMIRVSPDLKLYTNCYELFNQ